MGASLPRGGSVLPTSAASLIGACRFTTASPLPRCNLPPAELLITEQTKIHSRSPVRPFPRPSIRVEQERFGFPLGFAPRGHPRRTPGRERSIGHWTGSRPRQPTSNRRDHSLRATSRRTAAPSFNQATATTRLSRHHTSPLCQPTPHGALQQRSTATAAQQPP